MPDFNRRNHCGSLQSANEIWRALNQTHISTRISAKCWPSDKAVKDGQGVDPGGNTLLIYSESEMNAKRRKSANPIQQMRHQQIWDQKIQGSPSNLVFLMFCYVLIILTLTLSVRITESIEAIAVQGNQFIGADTKNRFVINGIAYQPTSKDGQYIGNRFT